MDLKTRKALEGKYQVPSSKTSGTDSYTYHNRRNVPQYLFRAWSHSSGGNEQLNTTTAVIPHAFLDKTRKGMDPNPYALKLKKLRSLARVHFLEKKYPYPQSPFSSWSASLGLVLGYCKVKVDRGERGVHAAVVDLRKLKQEVKVWHVPYLLPERPNSTEEFLAYGVIEGPGYVAIRYRNLDGGSLRVVFPDIERVTRCEPFGESIRAQLTKRPVAPLMPLHVLEARKLARHFGPLEGIMLVVLLSLDHRPWLQRDIVREPDLWDLMHIGSQSVTPSLALSSETWLMRTGMVNTHAFPDVKQWILLLQGLWERCYGRGGNRSGATSARQAMKLWTERGDLADVLSHLSINQDAKAPTIVIGKRKREVVDEGTKEGHLETMKGLIVKPMKKVKLEGGYKGL